MAAMLLDLVANMVEQEALVARTAGHSCVHPGTLICAVLDELAWSHAPCSHARG